MVYNVGNNVIYEVNPGNTDPQVASEPTLPSFMGKNRLPLKIVQEGMYL